MVNDRFKLLREKKEALEKKINEQICSFCKEHSTKDHTVEISKVQLKISVDIHIVDEINISPVRVSTLEKNLLKP